MKNILRKLGFGHNAVSTVLMSAIFTVLAVIVGFGAVALAQSSGAASGVSGGVSGAAANSADLSTIVKAATGKENLKWADVFGGQPGKDMYFMLYQQSIQEPDKKVLQESAKQLGLKEDQLRAVMNGDISPILRKNPNLPIDKAFEELEKIRTQQNEKLVVSRLKSDLQSEVQPSEMFANGDTSDSGFDLLVDLYRMEKILFDTSKPVDVGGNQLGGATGVEGRAPIGGGGSGSGGASSGGTGGSEGSGSGAGAGSGGGDAGSGVDPNVCLVEGDLDKALDKLAVDAETDKRLRDQSVEGGSSGGTGSGGASSEGDDSTSGAELVAPEAAKWENPVFCGDVLCITIDAKWKAAQVSPGKADCVACQVLNINASMKNLLSKSLLPSKLTGNLGEPGKCKEATAQSFTSIGLNVVAIPSPVKDPGNNDLVVGKPIDQEWQKFTNRYLGDGKTAGGGAAQTTVSTQDAVTRKALSDAPLNADLTQIYEKINQQLTKIENDRLKSIQVLVDASKIDDANTHFQALSYELNTMTSYFNSLKKLFGDMQVPCQALLDKKYCS